MEIPINPITAVTHFNPYPYYTNLVAKKPLYYDDALGQWIASSAKAVTTVLTSELCLVRPIAEPIPRTLVNSPAADIFSHLVRMTDGEHQRTMKGAASSSLKFMDTDQITKLSQQWAEILAKDMLPHNVNDFMFQLSVHVIGDLLGISRKMLPQSASWLDDFVRCLATGSNAEQIEKGKLAAGHLLKLMRSVLHDSSKGLLVELVQHAKDNGHDQKAILANGMGFLSQAYEATAGLIGNTLITLGKNLELYEKLNLEPTLLLAILSEVLRYDSPVQNTRRFIAKDGIIEGQMMKTGDTILIILAAANHDLSVNPSPEQFNLFRQDRHCFTFGLGTHACPGEHLTVSIAKAGLEQLIKKIKPQQFHQNFTYRHSTNTRIPLFS